MLYLIITFTVLSPVIGIVLLLMYILHQRKMLSWGMMVQDSLTKGFLLLALWSTFVAIMEKHWISLAASSILWIYLITVSLVQNGKWKMADLHKYGNWLFLCGLISTLVGAFQYVDLMPNTNHWWGYLFGIESFVPNPENRITATFSNANLAGSWFAILSILALYYFHRTTEKKHKNFYIIYLMVFASLLLLSGSRGAIAGLALGIFVYLYNSFKFLRLGFTVVFGLIVLGLLMHPHLIPRIHFWEESLQDRIYIWKASFELFTQHPVQGIGLANTYYTENNYYPFAHAHNTLLAVFLELGVIGGGIFLGIQAMLGRILYRLHQLEHPMLPLYLALFTYFIVHGLVDYTLLTPQVGIVFILLCALVYRTWKEVCEEREIARVRLQEMWVTRKTKVARSIRENVV